MKSRQSRWNLKAGFLTVSHDTTPDQGTHVSAKRHSRTVEAAASCIKLDSFLRQPMTTCPGNGFSHNGRAGLDQSPTDMAAGKYDLGVSSLEVVLSGLTVI